MFFYITIYDLLPASTFWGKNEGSKANNKVKYLYLHVIATVYLLFQPFL